MSQEKFFTSRAFGAAGARYEIPAPPKNAVRPGRWIPPGATVEVLDYIIRGGMLYVGTGMKDPSGTPEPSLINPLLAVQPTYGVNSTRSLGYWPNYSVIAPEARGAYLSWLASGRDNPEADIGFVLMYFYGLERRAFIDSYADAVAQAEWPLLQDEVRRLLSIYGQNRHFAEKATRFLGMLQLAKNAKNLVIGQGKYANSSGMPGDLKKDLGLLALAGTPLSADLAFQWANCDAGLKRGAALNKLPKYFKELFSCRYNAAHPEGLPVPVTRSKLMLTYEPASQSVAGFGELGVFFDDIPDVTTSGAIAVKLQSLLDECNAALSPYSTYCSRNPGRGDTFQALVLLPEALWPSKLTDIRALWTERVRYRPFVSSPAEILESVGAAPDDSKELIPALELLVSAGISIEPELSGKLPKQNDPIVLFHNEGSEGSLPAGPAYAAARVTLQLAHLVAGACEQSAELARDFISKEANGWMHLTKQHRARLGAYSKYLELAPVAPTTLKKNVSGLEAASRSAIASFLCRVAHVSGDVSPAMVKLLTKLYKMLEVDPARLHEDLHRAASGTQRARPAGAAMLDAARIASLQKDTAVVSALLADIFVEDGSDIGEQTSSHTAESNHNAGELTSIEDESASSSRVLGLDVPHSAFVSILRRQPTWSRAELQAEAAALGLMLDGALEHINDAAFDHCDMPLVEGDDPFDINPDFPAKL